MFFLERSKELELIDLGAPHYSPEEYFDCLVQLDKVGQYLGGDRATYKALKKLTFSPSSILDVGCGGGGFTRKLGQLYPKSDVLGIEISEPAIKYAQEQSRSSNVAFKYYNLADIPSKSYDLVIATLVCHHLSDRELIIFLKECLRVAKHKVIINDLHRHFLAWAGFSCLAPLLFNNRLITHDGKLSVRKAFKRKDWMRYLDELPAKKELSWHWPFRWILALDAIE